MTELTHLHQISQQIVIVKKNLAKNYFILGGLLGQVREQELYLCEGYANFDQYLASPEICMSYTQASRMISAYEIFIKKHKITLDELKLIDFSKVSELLPLIKQKNYSTQEIRGLLTETKDLTIRDLRIRRKELEKGVIRTCPHKWKSRTYWTCSKCGERTFQDPAPKEMPIDKSDQKE